MRFLNRQWIEGGYDDDTTGLYWAVYVRHLEDIAPDTPQWVRALGAMSMGKHFAGCPVSSCSLNAEAGVFHLVIELQTIEGGAFLDIEYQGKTYHPRMKFWVLQETPEIGIGQPAPASTQLTLADVDSRLKAYAAMLTLVS